MAINFEFYFGSVFFLSFFPFIFSGLNVTLEIFFGRWPFPFSAD